MSDTVGRSTTGGRPPRAAGAVPSAAASNVRRVAELEAEALRARSLGERLAAALMAAAGTATFALVHVIWFVVWIALNLGAVKRIPVFDPYPFNFLTLIVSLESIFLAIWILISQNQMVRVADRRAHLDLQINILAEQESTAALRMLGRICEHLGIDVEDATEAALTEETDVEGIATDIDATVPS